MTDRNANRKGYKKTPVGWIPEEWGWAPIGDLGLVNYGLTVNASRRESKTKLPYLTVANFSTDGLTLDGIKEIGCLPSDIERFSLRPMDVLVVEGNGSRDIVGMSVLWRGDNQTILHQNHLLRIRLKSSLFDPRLLVDIINSAGFRRLLEPRIITSSGLHTINSKVLGASIIPLPPLPEQNKIAEILSAWDEAIEQTRALIAAAKRRKKALTQQQLTGKRRLPGFGSSGGRRAVAASLPTNSAQATRRLPKGWRDVKIGALFEEVERPVIWDDDATYSLLSVRRASGGAFLREYKKGKDILTKGMFVAKAGDFLISKIQVLHGAMALVPSDLDGTHISGSYIVLRPKDRTVIDPIYFTMLSATSAFYRLAYISSYGVHIEKMTFNLEWFLESVIRIPSDLKEQRAIAAVLTTADEEIKSLEAKCATLENQKKGLMQELLTGQIRVRG